MTRWRAQGTKYGAKRALACRTCGMLVEEKTDGERFTDWHTPGHAEHDCDGTVEKFDSKGEARTWLALCQAADAGYIRELRRQVAYPIHVGGVKVGTYRADFVFEQGFARTDEGRGTMAGTRERIVDAKGIRQRRGGGTVSNETPLSRFKRKCVAAEYGTPVEIWPAGEMAL